MRIRGELHKLGGDVLASLDADLAKANQELDAAVAEREKLAAGLVSAELAAQEAAGNQESAKQRVADLRKRVAEALAWDAEPTDDLSLDLARSLDEALASRSLPSDERGVLRSRRSAAAQTLKDLEDAVEGARESLREWQDQDGPLPDGSAHEVDARTVEDSQHQLQQVRAAAVKAKAEREECHHELKEAKGRLAAEQERVRAAWIGLGRPDTPPEAAPDTRITEVSERIDQDRALHDKASQALEGARALTKRLAEASKTAETLEKLHLRARKLLGARCPKRPDRTESTGEWVVKVREALASRAEQATGIANRLNVDLDRISRAVKAISDQQRKRAASLIDAVRQPLEDYLELLMPHAPFKSVEPRVRYGKLVQTLIDEGIGGGTSPEALDPATTLSQGEMTGLALSYLFAFNSVFGNWCRWPGLVLDDPFQAVDVVRINTLFDILGGMVRDPRQHRQLILTTHDLERADWARRRLENQGASTRIYELHRSAHGLAVRDPHASRTAARVPKKRPDSNTGAVKREPTSERRDEE